MKTCAVSLLAVLGLAGTVLAPVTKADPLYKRTEVTFNQPVEIPGMVLPAGTYVLKLLDPYQERTMVRFYNDKLDHMYAMVRVVPTYRLYTTDHTVITFEERVKNAPQAIKDWFPAGDNWGSEFVYSKPRVITTAAISQPAPPQPIAAAPAPAPPPVAPAPVQTQPKQAPVEVAQAQPAPQPAAQPAAPAPLPKELPKTASDLPLVGLAGGVMLLAGLILRRRTA